MTTYPHILPSVLAADFAHLADSIAQVPNAAGLHIDIMDGHFVNNISFGPDVMAAIARNTELPLDVHLMIEDPAATYTRYIDAGADTLIFHYEAVDVENKEHLSLAEKIRQAGVKSGISIKPETPVEPLLADLEYFDEVLIMSVNPGFGGQAFMPEVLDKVRILRAYIDDHNSACCIEIDGGINAATIESAAQAGVDAFVAGSAVFKHDNPSEVVEQLYQLAHAAR